MNKNAQRYLVAKYIPDVRRMEPINIGVIVWARGRTSAKFLAPDEAAPLVNEISVYKRWMDFWGGILAKGLIEDKRGEAIPQTSPQFVEELLGTQRNSYQLVESGEILDRVNSRNVGAAAEYLYEQLVEHKSSRLRTPREQAIRLRFLCTQAMADAGITTHEEFKQSYPVMCSVGSVQKPILAHYAIGNGRRVFHRVQIKQTQSVCGSSFLFEQLLANHKLRRENCASLIYADEAEIDEETKSSIAMLNELSTVVNVKNRTKAAEDLTRISA